MGRINEKYRYDITPRADEKSIVKGDKYRFTVLTDRLIRLEYNENGRFEDRATQIVINREFEVPEFKAVKDGEKLIISTGAIILTYYTGRKFTKHSLFAKFTKGDASNCWRFGEAVNGNLKGTIRTLDQVNGETELDDGLMNRNSFTQIDDSKSLIISEDGWIDRRTDGGVDLYLFAYMDDYYGLLRDFYRLAGKAPLLPRYALGNMWSRYYKYTQNEYTELMDRFKAEGCPFSVAVLDMDWHLVNYDERYGSGWTGYTWNKELFPNYKQLLNDLHEKGHEVTLNLHPADGVVPYEEMYPKMAEAMGVKDGDTVEFDITNPSFLENYFEILHHPYETDGVTFWWMDWQQGNNTSIEGLDPLWMLNHYHSIDLKNSGKRPIMLSRYSGIGSHRYPIGFSGDTYITWESLDFQPYFTATASNAGYTWWSHDIGGHQGGIRDDELNTRWVQLGVFSPINRLHSTSHPLLGKEPWNFGKLAEKTIKNFLRLRHELVPYIYTMNYRTYTEGKPIVAPLYYNHPHQNEVYDKKYRNEYYFGTEMLVSPITHKGDGSTLMGCTETYIPEGIWFDFFNGRRYNGGRSIKLYRDINEMPVLVKAGGIIPMSGDGISNRLPNPQKLNIKIFAGADNVFELYEDDGATMNYENGKYALTRLEFKHSERPEFIIYEPQGDKSVIPQDRCFEIEFNGVSTCDEFTVTENGAAKEYDIRHDGNKTLVTIKCVTGEVRIKFGTDTELISNDINTTVEFIRRFQGENNLKRAIYDMLVNEKSALEIILYMNRECSDENIKAALTELLTADM